MSLARVVQAFSDIPRKRGEQWNGFIQGISLSDGTSVNIPIIVYSGSEDGPVLVVMSGVHGTELVGLEVIRRLMEKNVSSKRLKGTLIFLPMVNPLALQASTYSSPQDHTNMAAAFPGSPIGTVTRRLAAKIWPIFSEAELVIDLHTIGSALSTPYTLVVPGKTLAARRALRAAKAIGLPIAYHRALDPKVPPSDHLGSLTQNGIPIVIMEFQFEKIMLDAYVNPGIVGVQNVLKYLKMIPGRTMRQENQVIQGGPYKAREMTCSKGGLMIPVRTPGSRLSKGDALAKIYDVFGDVVETISSPEPGWLIGFLLNFHRNAGQLVGTGDPVAIILAE